MDLQFPDRASACLSEASCGSPGNFKSMGPISREETGAITLPNQGVTGRETPAYAGVTILFWGDSWGDDSFLG